MKLMVDYVPPELENGYAGRFGEVDCVGKQVSLILEAKQNYKSTAQ